MPCPCSMSTLVAEVRQSGLSDASQLLDLFVQLHSQAHVPPPTPPPPTPRPFLSFPSPHTPNFFASDFLRQRLKLTVRECQRPSLCFARKTLGVKVVREGQRGYQISGSRSAIAA